MFVTKSLLLAPRRLLLADGNEADIECYKDYLSNLGYDIRTAATGADALDCIGHFNPQVILLDPMIAKVNGFEVCKRIKFNPSTKRIMVVMISALNEHGDVERAVQAGTDDFLSKPVKKAELLKRVELLLKLHDHLQ